MDPLNLDHMDHYAVLSRRRGGVGDLNRLARDLVAANRRRPEAWLAVALHADARGDRDAALRFVEKAIALDSRHVLAFRLRGELLLAAGQAEHAIVAYFQANNYAKDLNSFVRRAERPLMNRGDAAAADADVPRRRVGRRRDVDTSDESRRGRSAETSRGGRDADIS